MPRRTIAIGNQPSSFQFQDDFGPLNNGLAYAAGQWLASGRDRAQIEMQRDAQAQQAEEREQDVGFRTQDMELRRLALSQQDQQRKDALDERKIYHSDQATRYADERKQRKARDDAEAGATLRDDFGATGKYFLDWFRGGNPANVPKDGTSHSSGSSAGTALSREKFNWERATQVVGSPDYDVDIDVDGAPVKRQLTYSQRAERIKAINREFRKLNGDPPDPSKEPTTPDDPHGSGYGFTPSAPSAVTGSFSDMALGEPAPPSAPNVTATVTPSMGSGQEQAQRQFMGGAGGWGTLMPSSIPNSNGMPPPVVDSAPLSRAQEFTQATGIDPDSSTGLTAEDFVSPDPDLRANALMKLPARERMKAIQALRGMGFN